MCEIGEDRDGCETMETNRIRKRLKKRETNSFVWAVVWMSTKGEHLQK